jgi:hypothetical protein
MGSNNLTEKEKRHLYESIMNDVSVSIKRKLNEAKKAEDNKAAKKDSKKVNDEEEKMTAEEAVDDLKKEMGKMYYRTIGMMKAISKGRGSDFCYKGVSFVSITREADKQKKAEK